MIHYHGIAGVDARFIATCFTGRHAFVSYETVENLKHVADICSTFALDNGAFSAWRQGKPYDFDGFGKWVESWQRHPAYHFHIIPDIIDGDEKENQRLVENWPLDGVPVWHLHESLEYLSWLAKNFKKVAFGSSGQYAMVGTSKWWQRMNEALTAICIDGSPVCKLHGLRMLKINIFSKIPFHSTDSTSVVRDSVYDASWSGYNAPKAKHVRGLVIAERLESFQSAPTWTPQPIQQNLF